MGITERKEKEKLEIRRLILEASVKLFTEKGFDNVSMRKIAELIEYSPTTVYLYFKDKNEILYNLHELGFQKFSALNANLLEIKNPLVRLHKMAENYVQFGLNNPEFYDIMFNQKAPIDALDMKEICDWASGDHALMLLKNVIKECMEKGMIIEGDVNAISMAVWGTSHGLVNLALSRRFEKLVEADQVIPMIHQSINWLLNTIDKINH